jgi:hypothetical protein
MTPDAWAFPRRVTSQPLSKRGIRDNGMAAIGNHAWEFWEHWEQWGQWGQWNPMTANENGNS